MSPAVRGERPNLSDALVQRWPRPPEVHRWTWRRMSLAERESWLVDHTFEPTPDGDWVIRRDHTDSTTARRVERAVTATEGAQLLVEPTRDRIERELVQYDDITGFRTRSNAFYVAVFLILLAVTVAVMAAVAADLFGSDSAAPTTNTAPIAGDADEPVTSMAGDDLPPTTVADEISDDEPVALTDGTWRFFLTSDETDALYDFAFFDDGTFVEDDAEHNSGTYIVEGATITLDLTRVHTVTASDGSSERSEEISWSETFTMVRTGNSMIGTWVQDDWIFSFDQGFVLRGRFDPLTGVVARPESPDDAG